MDWAFARSRCVARMPFEWLVLSIHRGGSEGRCQHHQTLWMFPRTDFSLLDIDLFCIFGRCSFLKIPLFSPGMPVLIFRLLCSLAEYGARAGSALIFVATLTHTHSCYHASGSVILIITRFSFLASPRLCPATRKKSRGERELRYWSLLVQIDYVE